MTDTGGGPHDAETERLRAEKAQRASESGIRELLSSIGQGFCLVEMIVDDSEKPVDYRFLEVNPAFEVQSGIRNGVGRRVREFAPDYEEHWFEMYGRVAATGEPVRFQHRAEALNRRLDVYAFRVGDPALRQVGILFEDITWQERAEAVETELQASAARLEHFKAALDEHAIVAITDATGRITYVNDKFCEISKFTRDELIGQDHRLINSGHHPKGFFGDLWQTLLRGQVWQGEIKNRAKDGTYYWVNSTVVPFLVDGKPVEFIAIRNDITERKQAEEENLQLNADLQTGAAHLDEANRELESFSYSVSHDLRAPLRHIQGYVDMLERAMVGQLPPTAQRYLDTIRAASAEMGRLIDDLLAFSRMTRTELLQSRIDLQALVQDVVQVCAAAVPERRIVWEIAPLPPVVGDPPLLRQAFINLMGNATKYSRTRDPARIEIGLAGEEAGRAVLFVRDNGIGFDPQYAHKLFGVFQRLHRADEFEGTGIGLATVQRVVARHGGRVWAEGAPDQGATFYLTLQLASLE